MKRRIAPATGLEAAPDIMLLTMAALMVAIVWLVSHAHEATLPAIELPTSEASSLGTGSTASVAVTLRPDERGELAVFIDDALVSGGLAELAQQLRASGAAEMTLRADARTSWQATLDAMTAASSAGMRVSVAALP